MQIYSSPVRFGAQKPGDDELLTALPAVEKFKPGVTTLQDVQNAMVPALDELLENPDVAASHPDVFAQLGDVVEKLDETQFPEESAG